MKDKTPAELFKENMEIVCDEDYLPLPENLYEIEQRLTNESLVRDGEIHENNA